MRLSMLLGQRQKNEGLDGGLYTELSSMSLGETDSMSSQSVSESKAEEESRQNSERIKLLLDEWAEQSFNSFGALDALQDLYKYSGDSPGVSKEIARQAFELCLSCTQPDSKIASDKIPLEILYMARSHAELPEMKQESRDCITSLIRAAMQSQSVLRLKQLVANDGNADAIKQLFNIFVEQPFLSAEALDVLQQLYSSCETRPDFSKKIAQQAFKLCIWCAQTDDAKISPTKIPLRVWKMAESHARSSEIEPKYGDYIEAHMRLIERKAVVMY